MNKLKDQRPDYPIGTIIEMLRPFGRLRKGTTAVAVEHYDDGLVLFKFGDDHRVFPPGTDMDYFLHTIAKSKPVAGPVLAEIAAIPQVAALINALRPFAGEAQVLRNLQIEGAYGGGCKYHTLEEYERVDAALAAYEAEVG